nr:hypothetical protein [Pandoravirus aubagnensis]
MAVRAAGFGSGSNGMGVGAVGSGRRVDGDAGALAPPLDLIGAIATPTRAAVGIFVVDVVDATAGIVVFDCRIGGVAWRRTIRVCTGPVERAGGARCCLGSLRPAGADVPISSSIINCTRRRQVGRSASCAPDAGLLVEMPCMVGRSLSVFFFFSFLSGKGTRTVHDARSERRIRKCSVPFCVSCACSLFFLCGFCWRVRLVFAHRRAHTRERARQKA